MDFPLTVKNPLTNQIIVGEVEFYLISYTHIDEMCVKPVTYRNQDITLQAQFIGSDYTYAYSQLFRDTIFRDNTLDEKLLIGISPKEDQNN